ncbi:diguanylate cyclase domain-containing protein [Brumicola nitratireducens]|uniref:GGDEF domain-containing protein n=1 Tax=Brumicola nitratireducens TaxID=300231 RepID=UPI00059DDAC1
MIIVQGTTPKGLSVLANRINESVAQLKIASVPPSHSIRVSIGFTMASCDESIKAGLERADKYLYISKRNGRNQASGDLY